jgi:hypothetical protein
VKSREVVPAPAFEIAGRLVSIGILAAAILRGGSPLLFLWGLWIDEVLSLAGAALRRVLARRRAVFHGYGLFTAVHLVFVLFFSAIGTTGLFSAASAPRLAWPSLRDALLLAGALALRTGVDLAIAWWRARKGRGETAEAIDRDAKFAVFLPHFTIIAGGFCLVMFRLADWLAWGILAGRVLFEAVAFFARREGAAPTASGREP